jgi:hypothetical protein
MPTSATTQYSGIRLDPYMDPDLARAFSVQLTASTTYAAGTVLGEVTATPGVFKAYASGSSDGSQNPRAILIYPCTTDGSGNITIPGEYGATLKSVPAFYTGTFRCEDITGLDATALTNNGTWKLIEGTTSAGIIKLG